MRPCVDEAATDIAALEAGLLALETASDHAETRRELLRLVHTIKGNASCVGLDEVATFAHAYEEMLERIDDGTIAADRALVTLLLVGVDNFRRLISGASTLSPARGSSRRTTDKLDRMLDLPGEI